MTPVSSILMPASSAQASRIDRDDGGSPDDLKRRAVRGALASSGAQAGTFVLRAASLMVLARLLVKEDFGLVTMVTAFTGFLALVRDAGLSMATVQSMSITSAQTSTLFWINLGVGGGLAILAAASAPLLAAFYGEPRLVWMAVAVATTFLFQGAAAQHRALLQRDMRFAALATIDTVALGFSVSVGIGMAVAGYGYWSLVAVAVGQCVATFVGVWLAAGWIPGLPRRKSGVQSMIIYGGTVTLNNLTTYAAFNVDKVLVGRVWGADALAVYGRAYQLINLPTDNLHWAIGSVALPALARVQNDPERLRRYFVSGYGFLLSLVVPITVACALFADDIVLVLLGPRWTDTAPVFRLLTPTILVFAVVNPLSWLMLATGRAARCVRISLLVTAALVLSYAIGLPYGSHGVAVGFSVTMVLSVVPVLHWATRGTLVTLGDILRAIAPSAVSITLAAAAAVAVRPITDSLASTFVRLVADCNVLAGAYLFILFFVMKQKSVYVGLLRDGGLWWRWTPQHSENPL